LEPTNFRFGGGVSETVLNPLVAVLILIAGLIVCFGRRDKALIAFLSASLLIPMDQVLLIGSLHFPMLRILILFGMARIFRTRSWTPRTLLNGGINKIDITVMLFAVSTALTGVLLFQESAALIFQLGNLYTILGIYFVARLLIRDDEDIQRMIRVLAYLAAFIALVMVYERATGYNPYALLGGARESVYASIMERGDRFRAMGCFDHPILAGTFGAILVPLFVGMWWKTKKYRTLAVVGVVSATVITIASNSSTPMLGYIAGILALCLWPIRGWMRTIRWGLVGTLILLHIVMKAPVWHLISRIDLAGGSSSYHRYQLVDSCIRHFSDWWLVGVKSTAEWGWDMWDTANQYVGIADGSGLIPFLLFLATIVYGFKYLGRARKRVGNDKPRALFLWAIGSALFANVVSFFGISYFDQTMVVWYGLLAAISAAALAPRAVRAIQPEELTEPVSLRLETAAHAASLSSHMIHAGARDVGIDRTLVMLRRVQL
jgi:hypothetical protein